MACRYYSIRTHPQNLEISNDIILAKFKPNPEFDKEFLDDEEVINYYLQNIYYNLFQFSMIGLMWHGIRTNA